MIYFDILAMNKTLQASKIFVHDFNFVYELVYSFLIAIHI